MKLSFFSNLLSQEGCNIHRPSKKNFIAFLATGFHFDILHDRIYDNEASKPEQHSPTKWMLQ